jgi:hypothetical protein
MLLAVGIEGRICCKREEAERVFSTYSVSVSRDTLFQYLGGAN